MNAGFWAGLLVMGVSIAIGAVLMRRSMNFREFVVAAWAASVAFIEPFLKKTWFWAMLSIGGLTFGLYLVFSSFSAGT